MEGVAYWLFYSLAIAVGVIEWSFLLNLLTAAIVKFIKKKKGK
jgi:hypothetical protein